VNRFLERHLGLRQRFLSVQARRKKPSLDVQAKHEDVRLPTRSGFSVSRKRRWDPISTLSLTSVSVFNQPSVSPPPPNPIEADDFLSRTAERNLSSGGYSRLEKLETGIHSKLRNTEWKTTTINALEAKRRIPTFWTV
jgi:hypothetical protein